MSQVAVNDFLVTVEIILTLLQDQGMGFGQH